MADLTDKTQNVNICSDDDTKKVTVTTLDTKECLDVNIAGGSVAISNDESPTKYQLKSDIDVVGDTVGTGSWTSLFSFTGSGIIDFIALSAGGSNYKVQIIIDATVRIEISMDDLGSGIGLANGTNVPLWVETANKNFRFVPQNGTGFKTSFEVKARAVTATPLIKHLCIYREKTA